MFGVWRLVVDGMLGSLLVCELLPMVSSAHSPLLFTAVDVSDVSDFY